MLPEPLPEALWKPWQREQMRLMLRSSIRNNQGVRIEEWKILHGSSRGWICVAEMADWCARRPGDIDRDPLRRSQAYFDLKQSILRGEFNKGGRCKVLYLGPLPRLPQRVKLRLDVAQFRRWLLAGAELSRALELCWVPHDLAANWFKARGIDLPPLLAGAEQQRICSSVGEPLPRPLSTASDNQIHTAITRVYDEHQRRGTKPPNVKQLLPHVLTELRREGCGASYAAIERRAGDGRHKARRWAPGRTVKSDLRANPKS